MIKSKTIQYDEEQIFFIQYLLAAMFQSQLHKIKHLQVISLNNNYMENYFLL